MKRTGEDEIQQSGAASPIERRLPWLVSLFTWYARRYINKHFNAVRLSRNGPLPELPRRPIIVALSHPSWWDPMMGVVLAPLFGDRLHVAPIEGAALQQYGFFERLGFFGIEPGTSAGYRRLLQVGDEAFSRDDTVFWITPQGHFADVRSRPLALRPGIGHLAHRMEQGVLLPVALEYTFWSERLPEALIRFGNAIEVERGSDKTPREWTALAEEEMTSAQDLLAQDSMGRNRDDFSSLLKGSGGVGFFYDLWRRLKSLFTGRRFEERHEIVLREREQRETDRKAEGEEKQ